MEVNRNHWLFDEYEDQAWEVQWQICCRNHKLAHTQQVRSVLKRVRRKLRK